MAVEECNLLLSWSTSWRITRTLEQKLLPSMALGYLGHGPPTAGGSRSEEPAGSTAFRHQRDSSVNTQPSGHDKLHVDHNLCSCKCFNNAAWSDKHGKGSIFVSSSLKVDTITHCSFQKSYFIQYEGLIVQKHCERVYFLRIQRQIIQQLTLQINRALYGSPMKGIISRKKMSNSVSAAQLLVSKAIVTTFLFWLSGNRGVYRIYLLSVTELGSALYYSGL